MSIYEQILGPGQIGAYERSILDRCMQKLYKKFKNNKNVSDIPILEDLYDELARQEEKEAKYLRTSLEVYVHGSLNYFNHRTNVDTNNRVICFDIKELGEQLKNLAMLVVQETVWGRVTMNRSNGKYTRYFVDEFHLLLKEPQTATYSKEIWKRFRKWGGIPVGITQNVSDLLSSPEIQSIFYNSDCYILLGQASGDADILKEALKLSNEQYKGILTRNKGEGLLIFGGMKLPFVARIDENTEVYKTITTKVTEATEEK
jgi:type IV secretory pathway VirB4 component